MEAELHIRFTIGAHRSISRNYGPSFDLDAYSLSGTAEHTDVIQLFTSAVYVKTKYELH